MRTSFSLAHAIAFTAGIGLCSLAACSETTDNVDGGADAGGAANHSSDGGHIAAGGHDAMQGGSGGADAVVGGSPSVGGNPGHAGNASGGEGTGGNGNGPKSLEFFATSSYTIDYTGFTPEPPDTILYEGAWTIDGDTITGQWALDYFDNDTNASLGNCPVTGSGTVSAATGTTPPVREVDVALSVQACSGAPLSSWESWSTTLASEWTPFYLVDRADIPSTWLLGSGQTVIEWIGALEGGTLGVPTGVTVTHLVAANTSLFPDDDQVNPLSFIGVLYSY